MSKLKLVALVVMSAWVGVRHGLRYGWLAAHTHWVLAFGREKEGRMRGLEPTPTHRPRTDTRAREPMP